MRIVWIGVFGMAITVVASCAAASDPRAGDGVTHARAELRDAGGAVVARAEARAAGSAVGVRVEAAGLAPGTYGAHIHMTGRCDPPGFESAGPHWNPAGREHGSRNPLGPHLGDLPNLIVGADGAGSIEFSLPHAALNAGDRAILDDDGSAIVIHAGPDDYRTDPSGNSGARIACGAFR